MGGKMFILFLVTCLIVWTSLGEAMSLQEAELGEEEAKPLLRARRFGGGQLGGGQFGGDRIGGSLFGGDPFGGGPSLGDRFPGVLSNTDEQEQAEFQERVDELFHPVNTDLVRPRFKK